MLARKRPRAPTAIGEWHDEERRDEQVLNRSSYAIKAEESSSGGSAEQASDLASRYLDGEMALVWATSSVHHDVRFCDGWSGAHTAQAAIGMDLYGHRDDESAFRSALHRPPGERGTDVGSTRLF